MGACRGERVMRIGEAAELTRTTSRTIRYPEAIGLLANVPHAEQPDLLVVADRARGRPGELGDLADPPRPLAGGRPHQAVTGSSCSVPVLAASVIAPASRSSTGCTCLGLANDTTAPRIDTAVRHHSAVCMFAMNGTSC